MDDDKLMIEPGVLTKAATIEPQEVTASDLAKINKYTLRRSVRTTFLCSRA